MLVVKSGQLRAYILSEEGREITLYRLFDMDLCLFSASCIMHSIQFEMIVEAEKDTELFIISPDAYKQVMEESAPPFPILRTNSWQPNQLKLTHETIGNHTGNPREVVTRMLRYFQSEGMVKFSRETVELIDIQKLEALRDA